MKLWLILFELFPLPFPMFNLPAKFLYKEIILDWVDDFDCSVNVSKNGWRDVKKVGGLWGMREEGFWGSLQAMG